MLTAAGHLKTAWVPQPRHAHSKLTDAVTVKCFLFVGWQDVWSSINQRAASAWHILYLYHVMTTFFLSKYKKSIILTTLILFPFPDYSCLCFFLKSLRLACYHYNRKVLQIKHTQLANQGQRHPRTQIPSSPLNELMNTEIKDSNVTFVPIK